ncbi:hypothetical protein QTP86_009137 [Hemibagrus guttatus]|nr:hypothetical protein QTP86_009137 [Hemibagrus guttatus]
MPSYIGYTLREHHDPKTIAHLSPAVCCKILSGSSRLLFMSLPQMHCSVTDKCVQHVQQLCPKNNDEESCEEEMDTSEPNWHWFYLAECGVWHMFEIDPSAGCSVTSEQIEANYNRNQHGSMDFYTPKYSYRLDFADLSVITWLCQSLVTGKELTQMSHISHWTCIGGLAGVFWIIVLLQNLSSLQLEVTNVPIYQSGKGYEAISKALGLPRTTVRAIIYKWPKHGTVENLPRSGRPTKITPRVQRQLIQEVTKDLTTTSKELQASLASVKVSVHDSTLRKRLGKNGLHGRVPRRKPLLSKKNIKARLSFARKHLDDPQDFWENTLWTDETKIELFGRSVSHYVWRKSKTAFQKKNIIATVKYGAGSVMVWGCFAASGPGRLVVMNGTMNSAVYQKILKENVRPSVCDLKLKRTWVLQQDNDPKHTSKSTSEWLKKNKMKALEWPSQSPDLNPIEML